MTLTMSLEIRLDKTSGVLMVNPVISESELATSLTEVDQEAGFRAGAVPGGDGKREQRF